MRKVVFLFCIFALVFAPLFAAPTEDEVGQTLEGVMMVYAAVMMGSMFGAEYKGAEIEMDMETGASQLVCDKLDVLKLFSEENTMGAMMAAGGEEVPEMVFNEISGTMKANEMGDFNIDVTLKGGPVKSLVLTMAEENVVAFKADGKSYKYLTDDPNFMLMEE
jgi:hypothetical protein